MQPTQQSWIKWPLGLQPCARAPGKVVAWPKSRRRISRAADNQVYVPCFLSIYLTGPHSHFKVRVVQQAEFWEFAEEAINK